MKTEAIQAALTAYDIEAECIREMKEYFNEEAFAKAVELLAKEYGISLEGAFGGSRDKEELYEINRQAARFYYRALRQHSNPGYT